MEEDKLLEILANMPYEEPIIEIAQAGCDATHPVNHSIVQSWMG